MTELTKTQWQHIVKRSIYLAQGRFIALGALHEILGEQRSIEQNRLQMKWHKEAAQQLKDGTAKEKRAFAKLHIGIPILCSEDAEYKAEYDRVMGPLPYETKLALMVEPFDFEVTRLMTKKQKTQFLDELRLHYQTQGVELTIPENQEIAA
jgi:hypothetical protein